MVDISEQEKSRQRAQILPTLEPVKGENTRSEGIITCSRILTRLACSAQNVGSMPNSYSLTRPSLALFNLSRKLAHVNHKAIGEVYQHGVFWQDYLVLCCPQMRLYPCPLFIHCINRDEMAPFPCTIV